MAKLCFCLPVLFFLLQISSRSTNSQAIVKYLPGFEGPLPFELETGYVGVDDSEVQLFYYFIKSEKNPTEDPLIVWLTGGPGCSVTHGLLYGVGPLYFRAVKYNGSLPTLVLNTNSWTKIANILFVDLPVGTGFSYATTRRASICDDNQSCHQAYKFLQKWLIGHSEYMSNPFYVAGDSYVGLTVPVITQIISDGNKVETNQYINLQGYLLGNPITNHPEENNYKISFAHGMQLISDEIYQSLVKSCKGEYQNINPNNLECLASMEDYNKCVNIINPDQILEPFDERKHKVDLRVRRTRALSEKFIKFRDNDDNHPSSSFVRVDGYELSNYWLNDKSVQHALHIKNGTKKEWIYCNYELPYTVTVYDSRSYHLTLSKKGIRSLIYSGDHDMVVPSLSTEAWIKNLNYSIVDNWRVWSIDDDHTVAGYTRTYSNKMTFATVKGGGHAAPEYKPAECQIMFKRWISGEPL